MPFRGILAHTAVEHARYQVAHGQFLRLPKPGSTLRQTRSDHLIVTNPPDKINTDSPGPPPGCFRRARAHLSRSSWLYAADSCLRACIRACHSPARCPVKPSQRSALVATGVDETWENPGSIWSVSGPIAGLPEIKPLSTRRVPIYRDGPTDDYYG